MAASMSAFRHTTSKGLKQESTPFEQEQDANSALSDLDRGLRSMNVGVQCEAVVRFPRLFEKYPFPILINSAFLRLADVFRTGNNFIRWCILRVTQQSEKHLDKIINVDEFMRRIFTVYHSNDPIARALTLRVLGNISVIIAERKNIHHSITVSLDSHDALEVQAAIFSAQKFSEQSRVFAANICDKISEMIHSIATPVELKLSLIPVLQYMHHDVSMATKARRVCSSLLLGYPGWKFKVQTLRTMSHLGALSLIDIPAQVELLLEQLNEDLRRSVKVICLMELRTLARKAAHLFNMQHTLRLCEFIQKTEDRGLKTGTVNVLSTLSADVTFKLIFSKQDFPSQYLDVCNLCYVYEDARLSARLVEFYTNIVIAYLTTKSTEYWCGQNLVDGVVTAIQTQMLVLILEPNNISSLKVCLKCAVNLVQHQAKTTESFVSCLASLLQHDITECVGTVVCECLAAIGSVNQSQLPKSIIPQLLSVLQTNSKTGTQPHQMQVYLCTVLFQVADGAPIPEHVQELMISCFQPADPWLLYRLARQGLRYGQCAVSEKIFNIIAQQVSSEHFRFWLKGLCDISEGGKQLQRTSEKPTSLIQRAVTCYYKALTSLKAAVTPSFPAQFQCEYVSLQTSLLEVHLQLLRTCNTYKTCPPPAIATAQALARGQEITKCEHTVNQLSHCGEEYMRISERVAKLYQQSFDADTATLTHLQQLQTSCELMKLAIAAIVQTGNDSNALMADKVVLGVGEVTGDRFKQLLHTIHTELATLLQTEGTAAVTYKHIEFLNEAASRLALFPTGFPRYFFQSLQHTALKLAISPQQTAMDPVLVQNDTFLTLKVEGIIQHGARPGLFRTIHAIHITVNSNITTRNPTNNDSKNSESSTNHLEQSVEPHNDYFTVSFILRFPILGLHAVSLEASIVDGEGTRWNTGPKVTLQVKSYDDAIQRQAQVKHPQRPGFSQLLAT